jgi:hypothetical protein
MLSFAMNQCGKNSAWNYTKRYKPGLTWKSEGDLSKRGCDIVSSSVCVFTDIMMLKHS